MIILYLPLVLTGFAGHYATLRIRELSRWLAERMRPDRADPAGDGATAAPGLLGFPPGVSHGVLLAPLLMLMLFLFAGSATVDRLMPANVAGTDAICVWISHSTKLPDGTCPTYGRGVSCFEGR
jgi:hypothetical protein